MLSTEDNERITRVGPDTPAGIMFRRYWQPALLSWEIEQPDSAPVRVRLLGEDLIAYRDSNGRVGLVDAYCPHRRAPMFYGRNEECGLRCVYHGWKFDVEGNCLDLPSEPADSPMRAKAKIKAYPTHESGGVVWTFMGPADLMPPPPDYEWLRAPETHRFVSKTYEACNYLQAMEGGLDTSHSSHLHNLNLADKNQPRVKDGAPRLSVDETDYGYCYVSDRDLGEQGSYVRVYHFVMPFQQMRGDITHWSGGKRNEVPTLNGHIWAPIDDEQTHVYNWMYGFDESTPITPEWADEREKWFGRGDDDLIPGTFQLKRNQSNDYLIDREVQKSKTSTGIIGVNTQDFAVQEGMGPIVDRSKEYLGTSDRAIIVMRKILLHAIGVAEQGDKPVGVDPTTYRSVRPHDDIVPKGKDWRQLFAENLVAKW